MTAILRLQHFPATVLRGFWVWCVGGRVNPVLATTMLVCGGIAAWIGWRRATKPIYRRSMWGMDVPDGMTRRDYERQIRNKRKRWRLVITFFYAIAGAIGGVLLLMIIARR